jgi:DNA-binding NarL/FixJ family response regulator
MFYKAVKKLFIDNDDFVFIDHCSYLIDALESLDTHRPDILITSSNLYDGRNVVGTFCDHREVYMPEMKIIVLTMVDSLDFFLNAFKRGVEGYVYKTCEGFEVYQCILDVANGEHYLSIHEQVAKKYKK